MDNGLNLTDLVSKPVANISTSGVAGVETVRVNRPIAIGNGSVGAYFGALCAKLSQGDTINMVTIKSILGSIDANKLSQQVTTVGKGIKGSDYSYKVSSLQTDSGIFLSMLEGFLGNNWVIQKVSKPIVTPATPEKVGKSK